MNAVPSFRLLTGAGLLMLATPVMAQVSGADIPVAAADAITVAAGEGSGNTGRVAVNVAAGNNNQQAGAAAIAIGGTAIAGGSVQQAMDRIGGADRPTAITIGAGAFSDNQGLVSINLTAGHQNQSANLAALAIGTLGVVTDQMLAQSSAPTKPAGPSVPSLDAPNDVIAVDDSAFGGNSGLVQVNLVGGERNSSANTFALNVSAGGSP